MYIFLAANYYSCFINAVWYYFNIQLFHNEVLSCNWLGIMGTINTYTGARKKISPAVNANGTDGWRHYMFQNVLETL